ncbi:hypothetical protein LINGRAPRIM_LOCUS2608 [Linum grandiflorum]
MPFVAMLKPLWFHVFLPLGMAWLTSFEAGSLLMA